MNQPYAPLRLEKSRTGSTYQIKQIAEAARRSLAARIRPDDMIYIRRNADNSLQIGHRGEDITGRVWLAMEGPAGTKEALAVKIGNVIEFIALNTSAINFRLL